MISINVTPTGTQPSEGSVSSAVVNDKIDKKIESFKTETFDAPLVTAPVGDEVIPVKRPDESFGTIQINQLGSGTSTGSLIEATYDELVSWADSGKLIPGQVYRMIDYMSEFSSMVMTSAHHPFDLILTALSPNSFSHEAHAAHSVRDIDGYFSKSNLAAWRIWYDIDNSKYSWLPISNLAISINMNGMPLTAYYMGLVDNEHFWKGSLQIAIEGQNTDVNIEVITDSVTSSELSQVRLKLFVSDNLLGDDLVPVEQVLIQEVNPGRGAIYRMIDEFNNDCPYDFKNLMYYVGKESGTPVIGSGSDIELWYTFTLIDNYAVNQTTLKGDGSILDNSLNNTGSYLLSCRNNTIQSKPTQYNVFCSESYAAGTTGSGDPWGQPKTNNNSLSFDCIMNILNTVSDCSLVNVNSSRFQEVMHCSFIDVISSDIWNTIHSVIKNVEYDCHIQAKASEVSYIRHSSVISNYSTIKDIGNSDFYASGSTIITATNLRGSIYTSTMRSVHSTNVKYISNCCLTDCHALTVQASCYDSSFHNFRYLTVSNSSNIFAVNGKKNTYKSITVEFPETSAKYTTYIRFDKDDNMYSYTDLDIYNKLNS